MIPETSFGRSETKLSNNEIKRTKHSIFWIPLITIFKYFFWNYENIYFLFLSLFQLSTLYFLPKEWSPTGPYSTAVPLLICILAEIITSMIAWYNDWIMDYKENNREYKCLDEQYKLCLKKNKHIYPGDIIYLEKEDICPVDGILIDTTNNEKYSKISLALLTGESNVNYVLKPAKLFKLHDYKDYKIVINNYYQNNFHNIEGKLSDNQCNNQYNIQGEHFVVGGSIIKSDDIYLWVIGCGKDKKSYLKKSVKNDRKKNRIDAFISSYMININAFILLGLILITTTIKLINNFSFGNILFYIIQNWILFNGIIPFSIKIFLLLARNLQAWLHNRYTKIITINNSLLIDDIGKINKILTDKTGTLTKNELEFSKLLEVWKNDIIDVETYQQNYYDIDLNFHKCIGLCIHQSEGENFSTPEDKTLRYRYQYLKNRINQTSQIITLTINNNNYDYKYIEIGGLDFTFERRLSSKIVKDINTDKYYIYCKGAMDVINRKTKNIFQEELRRLDQIISTKYPELRLLACGYREINKDELEKVMNDSMNKSQLVQMLENNLELLGIIGIRDNLQESVKETVLKFSQYGLFSCLLTGDRKITAIAIAKEAGIIEESNICDFNHEMLDKDIIDLHSKTILFSGTFFDTISKDTKYRESFYDKLALSKNFIGYNLIPEHKKKLANILENKNIKTLTIGDGFNDIGMFNSSSMSVAIKGNSYVENNADFTMKEFHNLRQLLDISLNHYSKNAQLINMTFFRVSIVILSILTYCLINYNQTTSLFNGFVIQAFNFAWTLLGIGYYTLKFKYHTHKSHEYYQNKYLTLTSYRNTSIWNIVGIVFGVLLTLMNYYWFSDSQYFGDLCGFLLVSLLNIQLVIKNEIDYMGIIFSLVGIINFMIYMLYIGSLYDILTILLTASKYYWLGLTVLCFGINLFMY